LQTDSFFILMIRQYLFNRLVVLLVCSLPVMKVYAGEGKPFTAVIRPVIIEIVSDTVPPVKTTTPVKTPEPDVKQDNPVVVDPKIIKVVPKARKQIKPKVIPVTPVKPPKVIKPIIKKIGAIIP
jgi:hypothetical protein